MARMSVDDMILRDPRVRRLAKMLGIHPFEAIGRLLAVFAVAYDRVTDLLCEEDVDTAADFDGFAGCMTAVGLAERTGGALGRIRIKGAKHRIGYLKTLKENASAAGVKSGEVRRNKANEKRTGPFDKMNGPGNPSSSASSPDPVPEEDCADKPRDSKPEPPEPPNPKPNEGQQALAAFHEYFKRTHDGAKPLWTDVQRGQIRTLAKKQGIAEVLRRLEILEHTPPKFPPTPWDVETFAKHFDKIAIAPKSAAVTSSHPLHGVPPL